MSEDTKQVFIVSVLVDGLPAGLVESALRCVGNAVVPQVPQLLAETIMALLNQKAPTAAVGA